MPKKAQKKHLWSLPGFIASRIKTSRWLYAAPVITLVVSGVISLILRFSPVANAIVAEFALQPPEFVDSWYSYLALGLIAALGVIFYFFIDYQQHFRPLRAEDPGVAYAPLHHAKVVLIPRLRYNWKQAFYWVSYGFASIIIIAATVSLQVSPVLAAAPSVTINQKAGTDDPNPSYTSVFEVVFSNPIDRDSFTDTDINLAGTAPGQTVQSITEAGSFDGKTFEIRVAASDAGTIIPTIPAGVVTSADSADTNYASTSTDNSVTYDGTWAPDEFVTTWKTQVPAPLALRTVTIPTTGSGYSYAVDWGDGSVDTGLTGDSSHTYTTAGIQVIKITGDFPRFDFTSGSGTSEYGGDKLLTVAQWGDNQWASMKDAFNYAVNLTVTATDAPDLSNVTDMESMFSNATAFNANINHWDVGNVTDMSGMFAGAQAFNQPLDNWDVGSVTDMKWMFAGAQAFNQPLDNWDVGSVTDMDDMLSGSALSTANYDATLHGWADLTLKNNVLLRATGLAYCAAAADRQSIIDSFGWTINDRGEAEDCTPPEPVPDFTHAFITTWKTDNPGSTADNQVRFTATGTNISIDWGDGNIENIADPSLTYPQHTYTSAGTYTIKITGGLEQIGGWGDEAKLLTVEQWGSIEWTSMEYAFAGARNLTIPASDAPDLSGVTSMKGMFRDASSFNEPINHWDVSNVTDMSQLFYGHGSKSQFNQPLDDWDTSNVTNMRWMFFYSAFNQDIGDWDVSNVRDMQGMFSASDFNGPLNGWASRTGNVTDMSYMFQYASSFNQPLNNWDVSSVTVMTYMFMGATAFNSSLADWDVSNVTSMVEMFRSAYNFNQPLNSWTTSNKLTTTARMFYNVGYGNGPGVFNQPLNNWDVSGVTDMSGMFTYQHNFNGDITSWNTVNVTSMSDMFNGAVAFNQDIGSWSVDNVTDMRSIFNGATSFNQPLDNWETGNVTNMTSMFAYVSSFNQSLATWDMSNVQWANGMLQGTALSTANYDATLAGWSAQSLKNTVTFDAGTSTYCNSETERTKIMADFGWTINDAGKDCPEEDTTSFITTWKTDNEGATNDNQIKIPTSIYSTYNYNVEWEEVGNPSNNGSAGPFTGDATLSFPSAGTYKVSITGDFPSIRFGETIDEYDSKKILSVEQWGDIEWSSMERAFLGATNLVVNANDEPDLSNVASTQYMFAGATSFNSDINDWDVGSVKDMYGMFSGAINFNEPLDKWDVSNVTDMGGMFAGATSFNSDINDWDVGSVKDMYGMFSGATSFNQPLEDWDTGSVTDMSSMFYGAASFNQNINSWDVSSVTDMGGMFYSYYQDYAFNQPLNNWDVSSVTNMSSMFYGADDFDQPLGDWDTSSVTNMFRMFDQASSFNQNINSWDVGNVTDMSSMFDLATAYNQPLGDWDTGSVTNMSRLFGDAWSFNQNINSWDTGNVTDTSWMFAGASSFNQTLDNWDTSSVTDMSGMFADALAFNQPLDKWDVGNVTDMSNMFGGAKKFNQNINSWNVSSVTDMSGMFFGATNLNALPEVQLESAFNQPLDNWNVSKVTDMGVMFAGAVSFNQDLSNWDVSSVTDMDYMFAGSMPVPPDYTFISRSSFNRSLGSWNPTSLTNAVSMLTDSKLSTSNYDDTLAGWSAKYLKNNVTLGATPLTYCDAETQRQTIINDFSWAITDGGKDCGDTTDPEPPEPQKVKPSVSLISPKANQVFSEDQLIELLAEASDSDGHIKDVKFYVDGYIIATDKSWPYKIQKQDGFSPGQHTAWAIATDNDGLQKVSKMIDFSIKENTIDDTENPNIITPDREPRPKTEEEKLEEFFNSIIEKEDPPKEYLENVTQYALTGVSAAVSRNIPWILLQVLVAAYLIQAYRQSRQNAMLKKMLGLTKQTRESLESFLSIVSHYLGTASTIIGSSIEMLVNKPGVATISVVATLSSRGKQLKNYINELISNVSSQASQVEHGLISGAKIQRYSLVRWVFIPSGIALVLMIISLFGMSRLDLWDSKLNDIIFSTVFTVGGIALTFVSFQIWQHQRQLKSDLLATSRAAEAALQSRREFIADNQLGLQREVAELESEQKLVDEPTFNKLFGNGLKQLSQVSDGFSKVYRLTSSLTAGTAKVHIPLIKILDGFKAKASQKNVIFETDIPAKTESQLLPAELDHVVQTLVDNAINFSPSGGKISVTASNSGKWFTLKVSDGGAGIPKDKLPTLMQPFARGTSTETYNYEGLGLNLYITRLIAEKYSGRVEIISADDKGTTITFKAKNIA